MGADLHTSGKYVVTTVLSANFRPANDFRALVVESVVSNLTKILPTPADCLLPPEGRGIFKSTMVPNLEHSSRTSSQISALVSNLLNLAHSSHTFVVIIV